MANANFNVPFTPQTGITQQILTAIQMANEDHDRKVRAGQAQQQIELQRKAQPSEIAQRRATAARLQAQTDLDALNADLQKQQIDVLLGNPTPAASLSPVDQLKAAISGKPTPAPTNALGLPGPLGNGYYGQTVTQLLADPKLTDEDKTQLRAAAQAGMLKIFTEPDKALDSVATAYNNILTRRGEADRAIKVGVTPDPQSPSGYSNVATRPDGSVAYSVPAAPPVPKSLNEATSYLGDASFNYQREPTAGNKAVLERYTQLHDAMYQEHLAELEKQTRIAAQARGLDVEAMYRIGKNPLTGEVLNLNNAPPSALVNPATGQVIPQVMVSVYNPTSQERQTADTARQVLAISADLKDEIAQHPGIIGPLGGRSQQALQSLGLSGRDASRLIDDVIYLQSAATKMHTGRFSNQILTKMGSIIKPGMNAEEFLGALDSTVDVANRYANEDKLTTVYEYQQRQQFENQGTAVPEVAGKHGFQ
jgi:hypothetical protein